MAEEEEESTNWKDYRSGYREQWEVYAWVWRVLLVGVNRKDVLRLLGLVILSNIAGMTIPWFFGGILHALGSTNEKPAFGINFNLTSAFVCISIAYIAREYLLYRQGMVREVIEGDGFMSIDRQSNRLFFGKSLGQHLREGDSLSSSSMEKGRGRVQESFKLVLFEGFGTLFLVLASYAFLWLFSPVAALIMTLMIGLYVIWSNFLNERITKIVVPLDYLFRALNSYMRERWERVERLKANGKEEEEERYMAGRHDSILEQDRPFWLWFIKQNGLRGATGISLLLTVKAYSAWRVQSGAWDLGTIYPVITWSTYIVDNLWRLSHLEHRLGWNLPSIRSMKMALTIVPDIVDKSDAHQMVRIGPIRLDVCNVSHTYRDKDGKEHRVLRDVSFSIEPGERVALIGRSGAGKSTIMRLIQRAMDATMGLIRVNGRDLRDIMLRSWLSLTGYIPQQSIVFNGTIRSNLLYGLTEEESSRVTDDELWALMRELQIDFGSRLTDGLDTKVGKNGIKLSGGEAQRLSIGSAVAKDPRFMLIDEATSSLDSTTEKAVQQGLERALKTGVSALIIAHRLSTVRKVCTKFVVLRHADETPEGESQVEAIASSFEELYAISPTFRQLADDQGLHIAPSLSATA